MPTVDPAILGLFISVMAVASGVLLLARRLDLLEQRSLERCAACGRQLVPGRRCTCID